MNNIIDIDVPGYTYKIYDPGGNIGKRIRLSNKPYEHKLLNLLRNKNLTGSAIDIGAHVGNHSLYFAIVCGLTVHAWEANKERYKNLQNNIRLNNLQGRVLTYPFAAGAGTYNAHWKGGRYMSLEPGHGKIQVHAADDLMNVSDVSVIKLDIEGMEPQALKGLQRHLSDYRPIVVSEAHDKYAHKAQANILEPLGYTMTNTAKTASRMEIWEWI